MFQCFKISNNTNLGTYLEELEQLALPSFRPLIIAVLFPPIDNYNLFFD